MLDLPVLRFGKAYTSLNKTEVVHFETGEALATVSQANPGLMIRDMQYARRAREILLDMPVAEINEIYKKAADLFENQTIKIFGTDTDQSPQDFAYAQSASTGMPVQMALNNMKKNAFVMANMAEVLDALTRGMNIDEMTRGFGIEDRGVILSYQCTSDVLGMVLPSNSPGVHTLWLPALPLKVGLILKPGSSEPWTPYRVCSALIEAGMPPEVLAIYPGGHDLAPELTRRTGRSMVFGGQATVDLYASNPGVQVHGPGYSKIMLGEDSVDDWESYLDLMVESVLINGGRSCINCSGIWAPRHTKEIAQAIAERIGSVDVTTSDDPEAKLAAFTNPAQASGSWYMLEQGFQEDGVTHMTESYGPRLVEQERCSYLRPVVAHVENLDAKLANTEYMFPYVSVVACPQEEMLERIGYTLVGTAITENVEFRRQLISARNIDRLNIGPIPTNRLNWLQPHEGNIVDFLYESRALQVPNNDLSVLV